MSVKIFNLSSISLLIYLFGYIQFSNTAEYCQYQKEGLHASKWCPDICCSGNRPRTENTTCCNPPTVYITATTSTFTLFGYSWWTIILSAICLFIAISILCHYTKRIHILKNSKHFNSVVDPTVAFTISKSQLNINLNNDPIILEQNPPSYSTSVSPLPPPPYATVNPSTIKILE